MDDIPFSLYPESGKEPVSVDGSTAPPTTSSISSLVKTGAMAVRGSGMPQQFGVICRSCCSASWTCMRTAGGDKTWPHSSLTLCDLLWCA